ncbi:CPBP family intramembrane glutamic endopeptidase [Kyrpidia tusciae]|uniref:Abortive infection protein n=1 Tax=Kyrpidia tusciae (strain DSM 2912 / NBRC 15312 / T2) TaxID=562970 RepID=D5WWW2_KYRT2|nr:type II CAAX endopeptidase family protein [Kyrpidia tusciae]ADG05813.1 Abortive infection protein [Kyrpidia tusciae DSM 2912]
MAEGGRGRRLSPWTRPVLYTALVAVAGLVATGLNAGALNEPGGDGRLSGWVLLVAAALVPVVYRFAEGRSPAHMGLRLEGFARHASSGALWGAIGVMGAVTLFWTVGWVHWPKGFSGASPGRGLISCLFLALWEELAFRGYLFSTLRTQYGSRPAVVGSALLYALYTAMGAPGPLFVCNRFLLGLLLAQSRENSDSLGWAVGFHWMWIGLQGPLFGMGVPALGGPAAEWFGPRWLCPDEAGLESGAAATAGLIVYLGLFSRFLSKRSS